MVIVLLANRLGLNSKNSSKPPSTDPDNNKDKKPRNNNKAGGQKGHTGTTLRQVKNPDSIEPIKIDKRLCRVGYWLRYRLSSSPSSIPCMRFSLTRLCCYTSLSPFTLL
ncbi:hypothetical protein D5R81_18065, partial [Parashewanella spongiae]